MGIEDKAKKAVQTAQAASDPDAREALIELAENKAREFADDPAKAIAQAQAAADAEIAATKAAAEQAVEAKLAEAQKALEAYQNAIPDPAKAVEDARAAVAEAKLLYDEAYQTYGPEAVAKQALEMVKTELAAAGAKAAQLEALAQQGLTGAAAMAEAVAGEIQGLVSVAVAACAAAGGGSAAAASTTAPPNLVDPAHLAELVASGVKFSPDQVVATGRNAAGQVVFLETGNARAGLQHIVEAHGADFANIGVAEADIPAVVTKAITEGELVGLQGRGRPVYEIMLDGKPQRIAVTTGSNGYIVGANPAGGVT